MMEGGVMERGEKGICDQKCQKRKDEKEGNEAGKTRRGGEK